VVRWALAAALFLAVCLGSFAVFRQSDPPAVANRPADPPAVAQRGADEHAPAPKAPHTDAPRLPPVPEGRGPAEVRVDAHPTPSGGPDPRATTTPPKPGGELASPVTPTIEPTQVPRPRLPVVVAARDLDQPLTRQKLLDEFRRGEAVHLDLYVPARDTPRGFDRLRTALQGLGVKLLIEPVAQQRLKNRLPTEVALYVESLTPDELALALQRLSGGEAVFDRLIAGPLSPEDGKELAVLIGFDPTPSPAKPRGAAGVDIRKPLADETVGQLTQSLAGAGAPRPEPGKHGRERFALVSTHPPIKLPVVSKEVRQFLDTRNPRPGAVPVYLIMHALDR
jgi:hypothetical protein